MAAFMVILRHSAPPEGNVLFQFFSNGHAGVTIFFVLSGFVIGINYQQELANPTKSNVTRFAVARIARIYPLYLFVLVGFGLLLDFDRLFIVLRHVLMIQAWSSFNHVAYSMNAPAWSVGVEAFFYVMFPLVAWLGRWILRDIRKTQALFVVCVAVLLLVAAWFSLSGLSDLSDSDGNSAWRWIYRNPLLRFVDFLLGMSVAALHLNGWMHSLSAAIRRRTIQCSIAVILLFMAFLPVGSAFSLDSAFAVPAAFLIGAMSVRGDSVAERFLGSRVLVYLGEISFAVYLIHKPIGDELFSGGLSDGIHAESVVRLVLSIATVVAVASVLHHAVENPMRRLVRKALRA